MFNGFWRETSEARKGFVAAVKEPGPEDRTVSPRRRLELLAGAPALSHLPDPVLEDLASRLTEERYRSADRVVVEGETDDRLYFIVEGRAEASTIGPSGIVPLATLGPGELFGELSLLEAGSSRQATVTAVEPLLLLSLRATDFRLALDAHPEGRSAFERLADDLLVTKLLKQASPFSTLDGERLRRLAARLERLEVPTGETIIRQGEPGEECYVLRSGRVAAPRRGAHLAGSHVGVCGYVRSVRVACRRGGGSWTGGGRLRGGGEAKPRSDCSGAYLMATGASSDPALLDEIRRPPGKQRVEKNIGWCRIRLCYNVSFILQDSANRIS
jgi:CRP-like cAMP-binding protein